MDTALQYAWFLPAAIGVAGVFYFAMQDLRPKTTTPPTTPDLYIKTKD